MEEVYSLTILKVIKGIHKFSYLGSMVFLLVFSAFCHLVQIWMIETVTKQQQGAYHSLLPSSLEVNSINLGNIFY